MEAILFLSSILSLVILFVITYSVYQTSKSNEKIKIYQYMQTRVLIEMARKEGIVISSDELYTDAKNA
ncbi:MAG TPA: hypothetical protein VJA82_02110 [Sediminibacterium sp.]|uniref:hypothetical protein n=1 Tax=Sediminibacterium sp. TaxID=1917865 RepID=UPI0008ADCE9D|nr:hypothetical protein [Sediminibacterium sp.]OHC84134.1 MAG: hypothetical protein A2472_13660 [Sphingobacteriia bacterium RIFOXYC2_FULL_35_18]OHC87819.1 MAG: hypothetical protein A2546_05510 [Sphingobacteriia bacterium RIFOXYD2_FULL_35_12]HLD52074.1 hypothetical protein [Sediminibacterium sp.]